MQPLWGWQEHGAKLPVDLDCRLYQVEQRGVIDGYVVSTSASGWSLDDGFSQHRVEYTNQLFRTLCHVCVYVNWKLSTCKYIVLHVHTKIQYTKLCSYLYEQKPTVHVHYSFSSTTVLIKKILI